MKIFKKIILAALLFAMVLSLVSCAGVASSAQKVNDASDIYGNLSWSYTSDDKTLTIRGSGEMPNAAKASDVKWASVRAGVEKIVMDSTITTIGDYAFYGMKYVKSVEIHSGVTSVGKEAFAFCSALEAITLPEGVATVGNSAFEGCSALLMAQLPASLTSVGARAFAFCGKLESVQILGALDGIAAKTFWNCYSLTELKLNPAVTSAADDAFDACKISFDDVNFTTEKGEKVTITIKYVDLNGNAMAADKVMVVEVGESYSVVSPSFDNFTADKFTTSGTAGSSDETIIVTYTEKVVESESEVESETEEAREFGAMDVVAIVLFVVVIGAIVIAGVLLVRADKKNAKNAGKKGTGNNGKNKK